MPGFRQARTYSCGFASALMVLRYFERDVPALDLFRRLGTGRDGTRQQAIVRELRLLGVSVNARYDVDFDRIQREIDRGKPLIAYLGDLEHWLVIYGYALEPRRVYVADPRPDEACEHTWDAYASRLGCFGMVCSPRTVRRAPRVVPTPSGSADTPGSVQLLLPFLKGTDDCIR